MACFHPLKVFRLPDGRLGGNPPPGLVPRPVTIPCGQCRGCRLERSRQWAQRCVHEAKTHTENCFITLTYNDKHLPDGPSSDVRYSGCSLDLQHWQNFAKKLRNKLGPFRFYHCGEYGEGKGTREINPHYHALIFGLDFSGDRKFKAYTPQGHQTWTSETLDKLWGKADAGRCEIGSVTLQSAHYVARYCMKRQGGKKAEAHYQGRKPEYATMSRRPGIGAKWFEQFGRDVFPHDYVVDQEGRKTRTPKYYDVLCEKYFPGVLDTIKAKRVAAAKLHRANNTPERLIVRETVLNAKLTTLKRQL